MDDSASEGGRRRRHIEREFGVPFAGQILPHDQWTKTSLMWRSPAPFDAETVFGRRAPLVVDLGCGNGRFLIGSAVWRPDHDHLGVDELPLVIRYAVRRANQRGLSNIRFGVLDARTLIAALPMMSATEIHCYHPQPYYRPEEIGKRLLSPRFLADARSRLVAEGKLYLQTDHPAYWSYLKQVVPLLFDFREQHGPWPDAPKGRTRREILALKRGLPVFRGWGTLKQDLSVSAIQTIVETAPLPLFDADRSFGDLDESELEGPRPPEESRRRRGGGRRG
jgi:tRNA (guanine-N7-)-methyltransferase